MNRCLPLFLKFRRFNNRYSDAHICWRYDIASPLGRSRGEVAFTPYVSVRQFSGLGVDRIPEITDDIYSDGIHDSTKDRNDFHNPSGGSSSTVGSVDYRQNIGNFQHQSSSTSHHATNDWTNARNVGHHITERVEVNLQHTGYSNGGNTGGFQQISNHQSMGVGSGFAYPPGSYQQEQVDPRSSWNPYHQAKAGVPLADSSGYRNVGLGPHQQNGFHSPVVPPQPKLSATSHGQSVGNENFDDDDNDVEGSVEELDAFCKDWDLVNALESMRKASRSGVFIDMTRYLVLIDACGKAKALTEAQAVHQHLIQFSSPVKVGIINRILEMYGKCGSMEDACNTFDSMAERNLTSWDTMITWFAKNGLGEEAIDMFTKFKQVGLKPDRQMFFGIFDACGVVGDVTEGLLHFDSMTKLYGITPTMGHYGRIVHMFGSAGDLDGALEFIEKMPVEPSVEIWESLMNIARVQGNTELGNRCAQIVEQLDPGRLSKELKDGLLPINDSDLPKKKVKKYNPLEHTKHEYRAGDRSHPENDKIYAVLRGIKESIKEAGYIPETKFVLHDVDQESKEEAIMAHSERLACTQALLTSGARNPLRIIKNLRVCGDCHNYFKIISSLVGRKIIMRDAKRFHHFEDGKCSCNDYW